MPSNIAKQRALILDRDGILNSLCGPLIDRGPRSLDELKINVAMESTLRFARKLGFQIFVASNQPDVSRNLMSKTTHEQITNQIHRAFPEIEKFYYCFHDNSDNCLCRKPKPGLLDSAVSEYSLEPKSSYFIGDKWTDVVAGKAANFKTILMENSSSWTKTSQGEPLLDLEADFVIRTPSELNAILLN